jgi:hypothetical protein
MASTSKLSPNFTGFISDTKDALILFEAYLSGKLKLLPRRPNECERAELIRSGNVFIYKQDSKMKRWTDGVIWSPSRVLGDFFIYRELAQPFRKGEKRKVIKRSIQSPRINKTSELHPSEVSNGYAAFTAVWDFKSGSSNSLSEETENSLVGSLVDSFKFKDGGLVKKTISVKVKGVLYSLVAYYALDDVKNNKLQIQRNSLPDIVPRSDLYEGLRNPITISLYSVRLVILSCRNIQLYQEDSRH